MISTYSRTGPCISSPLFWAPPAQVAAIERIPAAARRTLASFLAMSSSTQQDPLSVSAPQANAYEFQSGGVVEMLEDLKDKSPTTRLLGLRLDLWSGVPPKSK